MNDEHTQNITDSRSFEERVFLRFDALDSRMLRMESRLENVESRLGNLESRLENVESRLGNLELRMENVDSRLHKLEDESERSSLETKPIWERALAHILELQQQVLDLREEVREGFRDISRKFAVVGHDIIQLRADQTHLETRLGKLESKSQG